MGATQYAPPLHRGFFLLQSSVFKWSVIVTLFAAAMIYVRSDAFRGLTDYSVQTRRAAETVAVQWLEAQRRGGDGARFWHNKSWVEPSRLYSIRSWEIVDVRADTISAEVVVIIESSTRGGIPIAKTWKVDLVEYNGELRIEELHDLSDGGDGG